MVPALRELLGTQTPGANGLVIALALAAVPGIAVALSRRERDTGRSAGDAEPVDSGRAMGTPGSR